MHLMIVSCNVEAALSHAIKLEAFEQSLAYQGTLVDHIDGRVTCWLCTVCAGTGLLEAGETAALCKLIEDLRNALAQVTRGVAGWQLRTQDFGVVVPLRQVLHPLSAPSWTLFRYRQHRHLDTHPRVSQVVEVAVDA